MDATRRVDDNIILMDAVREHGHGWISHDHDVVSSSGIQSCQGEYADQHRVADIRSESN